MPPALATVMGASGISSRAGVNARISAAERARRGGHRRARRREPMTFADQAGTYLVAEPLLAVPA